MKLGSVIVGLPGARIATNVCAPLPTIAVTGQLSASKSASVQVGAASGLPNRPGPRWTVYVLGESATGLAGPGPPICVSSPLKLTTTVRSGCPPACVVLGAATTLETENAARALPAPTSRVSSATTTA